MEEVIPQNSENGRLAFVDKESSISKFDRLLMFVTQASE